MRILVIGVGNIFRGDDGIGVKVARALKKFKFKNIDIVEGGQDLDYAMSCIHGRDYIVIIDSANMGRMAGTIYKIKLEDAIEGVGGRKLSFHTSSLVEYLGAINSMRKDKIKGIFIGIEAKNTDFSDKLSPELSAKFKFIVNTIKEEITNIDNSIES